MDVAKQTLKGSMDQGTILIKRQIIKYRNEDSQQNHLSKKDYQTANMSNAYINYQATKQAVDGFNKSPLRTAENAAFFVGLPAAISLTRGALKEGTIAEKAAVSLKSGKRLGLEVAALLGTYSLINKLIKNNPTAQNFNQNHPVITNLGTAAGAFGVGLAINPVVDSIAKNVIINDKSIGERFKNTANSLIEKVGLKKPAVKEFLEKSVFEPAKSLLETSGGKFVRKHLFGLTLGAVAVNYVINVAELSHRHNKIVQNLDSERQTSKLKVALNQESEIIKETSNIYLLPGEKKS